MEYKLLAADLDSTALNSEKIITPRTLNAMEEALRRGKHIVFSTGRSIALVRPYISQVKGMRYVISSSGASVSDTVKGEHLLYELFDAETVRYIVAAAAGYYVMPAIYRNDECFGTRDSIYNCADFRMGAYKPMYLAHMKLKADVFGYFMESPSPVEKVNLFFANDTDAAEVYEKLHALPLGFTAVTTHSIEMNAVGVSKARGLRVLCEKLGIDMSECIAVGDAENDADMIGCAGLGVAMGNAIEEIKSLADVITGDCDHDGVADVIEDYLLANI